MDAIGGGGWGPTVTSTLLGSEHGPRMVIVSVNSAEFFVTVAAATTLFVELGLVPIQALVGLTVGGVLAAPRGARATTHAAVGLLVLGLAGFQIARSLKLI